jgi:transaldolase
MTCKKQVNGRCSCLNSHANLNELFATAELGVQHSTILGNHLAELAKAHDTLPEVTFTKPKHPYKDRVTPARFSKHSTSDPLAGPGWDGKFASTEIDYISNNGENLTRAIKADPVVTSKIKDVLDIFHENEEKAREMIEKSIKEMC